MILLTSKCDKHAAARTTPVDTYIKILGLVANAAYIAQHHLHHHLKSRLTKLDALLPAGFCSDARKTSFISSTSGDRSEAFSLFACATPQPLSTKKTSTDNGDLPADDLMRMQLKVTESMIGLSDKDVKCLTIVKHSVLHS